MTALKGRVYGEEPNDERLTTNDDF